MLSGLRPLIVDLEFCEISKSLMERKFESITKELWII